MCLILDGVIGEGASNAQHRFLILALSSTVSIFRWVLSGPIESMRPLFASLILLESPDADEDFDNTVISIQ